MAFRILSCRTIDLSIDPFFSFPILIFLFCMCKKVVFLLLLILRCSSWPCACTRERVAPPAQLASRLHSTSDPSQPHTLPLSHPLQPRTRTRDRDAHKSTNWIRVKTIWEQEFQLTIQIGLTNRKKNRLDYYSFCVRSWLIFFIFFFENFVDKFWRSDS